MLHFIAGFAFGLFLTFPIFLKRSRIPDWMCEELDQHAEKLNQQFDRISEAMLRHERELDSIIARIEERSFENAFKLGQEAERTKRLLKNKEAL